MRASVIVLLLTASLQVQAAFYSEGAHDWGYRAPIELSAGTAQYSTVVIDANFVQLFSTLGVSETLDNRSPRVVTASGNLVNEQEFNDTVFAGLVDTEGNGRGEIRFIMPFAPGSEQLYLYWDSTANGSKPANPATPINGTFEQSNGSDPSSWLRSSIGANGNQNNEVVTASFNEQRSISSGCGTSGATVNNAPNTSASNATGRRWHLIGYRDRCEDGGSSERVRLSRNIRIPSGAAAGTLTMAIQIQGWDGISNSSNYDWLSIYVNGAIWDARGSGLGANNLRVTSTQIGRSGFSASYRDHGWQTATLQLSGYAGQTINLRFETRASASDNSYRSWAKIDDVQWSLQSATIGSPEADSVAVAGLRINHDAWGIYCLSEAVTVTVVDAAGNVISDFEGEVIIDTQNGLGSFSLISGSGSFASLGGGRASYSFVAADAGQASFALSYTSGAAPLDIDAYLSSDTSIRDDDSEGILTFTANGFTVTGTPLSNPPPNPINQPVPTQAAAQNFALYITAYGTTATDPVCGVIESYQGTKSLRFWTDRNNPTTGTRTTAIDGQTTSATQAAATPQNVVFSAGQASVSAAYKDVGRIRIGVVDATSYSHSLSGQTNLFVVRPAELRITSITDTGGTANPAATSMTGSRFVPSGSPFTVTAMALDADGNPTPNFGLETPPEAISVSSQSLVLPAGGRNGSTGDVINGDTLSRVGAGVFRSSAMRFDEVGIIRLQPFISDDSYLSAGSVPGSVSGNVGRFYPATYVTTASNVTPACNAFTYQGHPALGLSYTIEARNIDGAIVENYDTSLIGSAGVAVLSHVAENNNNGVDLSSRLSATVSLWENGVASATISDAVFSRGGIIDGPFDALQIGVRLVDALDGNTLSGLNMQASTAADCSASSTCDARAIGSPTQIRYGRMMVLSANGPEVNPLDVPIRAQYYDGSNFRLHDQDQCSEYSLSMGSLTDYEDNLNSGETLLLAPAVNTNLLNGEHDPANPLRLSAPGAGNTGSVQLLLDVPSWLEFDWFGSGDVDPRARQTFGRYRGHDRVVFWDEVTR